MEKIIENPKVFISYAWGSEEHDNKILAFASQLVGDGIDVLLDKWNLTEGNDTYAFMEKCVNDPSVTNVLMLLDPLYAKKADDRSGGVGTETQIISAEIYRDVAQDKFIPIVMERDEAGNVCKPAYLKTRLHFDLSMPEKNDSEYQRLVKKLYGVEIHVKPTLGKKPDWVDKPITVNLKTIIRYDSLKSSQPAKVKEALFEEYLGEIKSRLLEYSQSTPQSRATPEEYLSLYDETSNIKEDFLQLVKNSLYIDNSHKRIAVFFEETKNGLHLTLNNSLGKEVATIRIHELFLYVVAYYLKIKDYSATGHLLGKTYFNHDSYRQTPNADSFTMFYSGRAHQNLDNAINKRDNKNYLTGTGNYWIETLQTDFCNKEQFVLADLICFNYLIYGKDCIDRNAWFPITYIYDNKYISALSAIGNKMISREYSQEILPLFGFNSVEAFKIKMKEIEESPKHTYKDYKYDRTFESAPILGDYIKADDVATLR